LRVNGMLVTMKKSAPLEADFFSLGIVKNTAITK
jgi:hypothetical protein